MSKFGSRFEIDLPDGGKLEIAFEGDSSYQKQFDQLARIAAKTFTAKARHIEEVAIGQKPPCLTCGDVIDTQK